MMPLTPQRLVEWVELLGEGGDVRLLRVLAVRDSILRGVCDSDCAVDCVVEKLGRVLQGQG